MFTLGGSLHNALRVLLQMDIGGPVGYFVDKPFAGYRFSGQVFVEITIDKAGVATTAATFLSKK